MNTVVFFRFPLDTICLPVFCQVERFSLGFAYFLRLPNLCSFFCVWLSGFGSSFLPKEESVTSAPEVEVIEDYQASSQVGIPPVSLTSWKNGNIVFHWQTSTKINLYRLSWSHNCSKVHHWSTLVMSDVKLCLCSTERGEAMIWLAVLAGVPRVLPEPLPEQGHMWGAGGRICLHLYARIHR